MRYTFPMGTIHRQSAGNDGTWDYNSVSPHKYEGGAAPGAVRRVLIGRDEGASEFVVRYFTIPPGGHSAHESHKHPHGVVVVQGGGQVLLGDTWHDIGIGDAIFIEPDEVHQLRAPADQPLGFICVIPPKESPRNPLPNAEQHDAAEGRA
jgi:quercetin dioxygenase-like cupin family protein